MAEVTRKAKAALVMAFIECLLFSGIIHGWTSLVFVFHQEGIYEYLCHNTSNIESRGDLKISPASSALTDSNDSLMCPERNEILNLAYTVAAFTLTAFPVMMGKIFDRFGLRTVRLIASGFFIPGCALLAAYADTEQPWMIFPGLILISMAGSILIFTNNHVALLAGDKSSTVAMLYSAGTDSSVVTFLLVKILWENGISRTISLGVLTGLWMIVILDTFLLMPKFKVSPVEAKSENASEKHKISIVDTVSIVNDVPSIKDALRSPVYLLHIIWFSLLFLRIVYYLGSFHAWISDITDGDVDQVSHLTNVQSYITFGTLIVAPLLGLVMDWSKKRLKSTEYDMSRNAFAAMPVLFFGCSVAVLLSACVLSSHKILVYASFVLIMILKSSTFAIFFAYFNLVIPKEHYGLLLGLGTSTGAIFSLLQYPLNIWAEHSPNKYQPVNIFLLCVCVLAFAHPICICVLNHGHQSTKKDVHESNDTNENIVSEESSVKDTLI